MSGVNKVIILGRVGKDPDIKSFNNGGKIASFSVATSESWKNKQTGEKQEKTEWHNVKVQQDGLIEIVEKYVKKGDQIYLEGKLETRKWQDKSGSDHYTTEVIVNGFGGKIQLIGGKKDGGSRDGEGERSQSSAVASGPASRGGADIDDDIPF